MVKGDKRITCGESVASCSAGACCCKVEAMLTVDERGQMVLPKDIREKADICPGDKMALVTWEKDGKVCCMALIKSQELAGLVKNIIGPLMKDLIE